MRHRPLVDGVQREERREPPASQIASILNEDEIAAAWRRRRTRRRQGSTLELLQEIKKKNIFRNKQIPRGTNDSRGRITFLGAETIPFSVKSDGGGRRRKQTTPTGQFQRKDEGGKKQVGVKLLV